MTTIDKIINYFQDNEDIFNDCITQLDAYNGYLGDDYYYNMDDLNEYYNNAEPIDLLYRAFYGHDADTWTTDARGDKTYGPFNPNRNYFYYNGYGNLVSTDYIDYSDHLNEYTVNAMLEDIEQIDAIEEDDELQTLFEELKKEAANDE
jgi:hypothetical protein